MLIPLAVLSVELLAAFLPCRTVTARRVSGIRCDVLIPAHNEQNGLAATLREIRPQLEDSDNIVVVADNCTDGTVIVAHEQGARVVERHDPVRRGKGYALDFAIRAMAGNPPDVVAIVDADCRVVAGSLDKLIGTVQRTGQPVQAVYLMDLPPNAGVRQQLSCFAFRLKNLIRPLGLKRLGLPCLITMGGVFPRSLIQRMHLASGNIVEDMQLGIDLALDGHPPLLCEDALIISTFPTEKRASHVQRKRWEHGHLRTLLTQAPRLFFRAIRMRRLDLFGLALELSIPPLGMLGLLFALMGMTDFFWFWMRGQALPGILLAAGGTLAVTSLFAAWYRFGRDQLPFWSLLGVPLYLMSKIPIYIAFVIRPEKTWIRTNRDGLPQSSQPEP